MTCWCCGTGEADLGLMLCWKCRKKIRREAAQKYEICAYEKCGRWFKPNSPEQKFCCAYCSQAHEDKKHQADFEDSIGAAA